MAHAVFLQVRFKPGTLHKAVVLSEEITGYSKNSQPSCLAYFFFTKEDEPDTQYGIELYTSEEDFTKYHLSSVQYARFRELNDKADLRQPGPPNIIVGTPICGFLIRKAPNGKVPAPPDGETISRCTINPSSIPTIRELGDVLHSLTDEVQGDESVLSFWAVKSEFRPFGEAKEEHESKVEIFARFASQEAGTRFWDKGGRYEQSWDKIKRAGGTMLDPEYFSRLSGFLDSEEPEV